MNAVVEGNGVKVFGKAIHALSRIGETLWLDPGVKGLALRSVNAAHSAYGCFLFSPLFFQRYSLGSDQGNEPIECRLIIKSVLPLFRCSASIERCRISISAPSDQVEIQFICRHGITKTHTLRFQQSEALQAVFHSHLCPNVLKLPARLLCDIVMHFPVFQEEISLSTTPFKVCLRNYYERETDHRKTMHTEMSLHPDEFDCFRVGVEADITFCLKELRGFLSFAEAHCLQVSIHFGAPGKPVCFSVEDMVLEATVVLATMVESESKVSSELNGPLSASTPTRAFRQLFLWSIGVICCLFVRTAGSLETFEGLLVPKSLPCADPADLPGGFHAGDGGAGFDVTAVMEVIPSSQGSPTIDPPNLMQLLPQFSEPSGQRAPDKACSASNSSVPTKICSLLFRALSSELDDETCTVLARYSDTEEDGEDDA